MFAWANVMYDTSDDWNITTLDGKYMAYEGDITVTELTPGGQLVATLTDVYLREVEGDGNDPVEGGDIICFDLIEIDVTMPD